MKRDEGMHVTECVLVPAAHPTPMVRAAKLEALLAPVSVESRHIRRVGHTLAEAHGLLRAGNSDTERR